MGSPIKYEAVAQTKEPITINRENLDLKFPGKKSKGGCAWTVDELDEVGPPWNRGTSGNCFPDNLLLYYFCAIEYSIANPPPSHFIGPFHYHKWEGSLND